MEYRVLGKTNLKISNLSYGGSPLGGFYGDDDEQKQIDSIKYAISKGINFIDTSPYYGITESEKIIGKALKSIPRDKYIISTKVGRYQKDHFNYSYENTIKSVRDSMGRLGLNYLDIVLVHDIEFGDFDQIINESIPALLKLKSEGTIGFIGVSGLPLTVLEKVVRARPNDIDVILSYCHYCLNDSTLENLIPLLKEHNIGIINASFLSMGMLTERGPPQWHPAPEFVKDKCREAAIYCKERGNNISKLALQFSFKNPDITTHLVGMPNKDQVDLNLESLKDSTDNQLLQEVLDLLSPIHNLTWESGKPENN
eukprot:gene10833-13277_t